MQVSRWVFQQDALNDKLVSAFSQRRKDNPGLARIILSNPFQDLIDKFNNRQCIS